MTMIRHHDHGELARPVSTPSGRRYEGRAARTHAPGDALEYSTGPEHRDAAEVRSIAQQLAARRIPVTIDHPRTMPASTATGAWIIGHVVGGRVDGDHAVATFEITDPRGADLIAAGVRELSLGYATDLDAQNYQRNIEIDHLALVQRARCGSSCAVRADANQKGRDMCKCNETNHHDEDPEKAAAARAKARLQNYWKTDGTAAATAHTTSGADFVAPFPDDGYAPQASEEIAKIRANAKLRTSWIADEKDRAAAYDKIVAAATARLGGGQ